MLGWTRRDTLRETRRASRVYSPSDTPLLTAMHAQSDMPDKKSRLVNTFFLSILQPIHTSLYPDSVVECDAVVLGGCASLVAPLY